MLQKLAPIERAVFLLHEVFDHDYDDVARIVGKSAVVCRQIVHRAKEHLADRRTRFHASDDDVRAAIHRFADAARRGDDAAMRDLLDPEVTLYTDGGDERPTYGRARALTRPLHGADAVARFLVSVQAQAPEGMRYEIREANGAPALYSYRVEELVAVMSFDLEQGRVRAIFLVADPKKLSRVRDTN
jgi:RNA polymerase sigma-70 factor (ECF subfamily)